MSLLLEALKKAEKAKEEAQRRAQGGSAGAPGATGPGAFDPEATVLDQGRHVTTRDQLPEISQPLEILSEDIRPAASAKPAARELSLAEEPAAAPREAKQTPKQAARNAADARAAVNADRATAQRVFEAKFKEPNPRLPFYITMAILGLFAVGTVVYFWIQLRPPPPLVSTNPQRPSDEKPVETTAASTPNQVAPVQSVQSAATPAIPGLPSAAPAPAAVPATASVNATSAPAVAIAPAAPAAGATAAPSKVPPSATPPARPAAPRAAAATLSEDRTLSVNRGRAQIHPQVAAGYAAFQLGDLQKSREAYEQVLRDDPSNRDALLGLAAVEMRSQRYDLSDAYYQRVLRIDPRDAHAQAGVVALRAQQLDPVAVESRVKSLIASDREANVLYFTLGNQYAQQGRWAEAQEAYFKALAADPENPDFAFNLAVSLDQLRKPALALEYYRKSLSLAEKRSAGFALEAARTRAQQLSR
jgi:tetratricopeptide (TPR) repeat protein